MNYILAFLGLCLLFVVVRIVAIALAIVWLCFLLYAAITHPRETLAWFVVLGLVALARAQPLACLVVIGVVGVAAVVAGALGKTRDRSAGSAAVKPCETDSLASPTRRLARRQT